VVPWLPDSGRFRSGSSCATVWVTSLFGHQRSVATVCYAVGYNRRINIPEGTGLMSRRRERHLDRTPIEEVVRQAVADLLGSDGSVYVERSGSGDLDSVLVQVSLGESLPVPRSVQIQHELRDLCQRVFDGAAPDCCAVIEQHGERVFLNVGRAGRGRLSGKIL